MSYISLIYLLTMSNKQLNDLCNSYTEPIDPCEIEKDCVPVFIRYYNKIILAIRIFKGKYLDKWMQGIKKEK